MQGNSIARWAGRSGVARNCRCPHATEARLPPNCLRCQSLTLATSKKESATISDRAAEAEELKRKSGLSS